MSYFVNLSKANSDNSRLSAELVLAAVENGKLALAITERDSAAESCRAQFDASMADLTAKLSEANAQTATLAAAAQTAGHQAAEIVAAQGIDPAKLPKLAAKVDAPTMAREQFNALTPFDRMQFAKSGGRLTE